MNQCYMPLPAVAVRRIPRMGSANLCICCSERHHCESFRNDSGTTYPVIHIDSFPGEVLKINGSLLDSGTVNRTFCDNHDILCLAIWNVAVATTNLPYSLLHKKDRVLPLTWQSFRLPLDGVSYRVSLRCQSYQGKLFRLSTGHY